MTGARANARSRAVWPLAGSYFAGGHEVGLPDRREPWRVPASVGQLERIYLPTSLPPLNPMRQPHAVRTPAGWHNGGPLWCSVLWRSATRRLTLCRRAAISMVFQGAVTAE